MPSTLLILAEAFAPTVNSPVLAEREIRLILDAI